MGSVQLLCNLYRSSNLYVLVQLEQIDLPYPIPGSRVALWLWVGGAGQGDRRARRQWGRVFVCSDAAGAQGGAEATAATVQEGHIQDRCGFQPHRKALRVLRGRGTGCSDTAGGQHDTGSVRAESTWDKVKQYIGSSKLTCLDGSTAALKALRKFMASVGALDGVREYLAARPAMGVGAGAGGVGLPGSIMATTVDRDD